jgi:phosphate transport system substrate-binding protein
VASCGKQISPFVSLLLFLLSSWILAHGQRAERLSQVRKLYLDSFGDTKAATAAHDDLLRRLRSGHSIQIVSNRNDADAVITGTARIWTIGHIVLSPRSQNPRESVIEGFLSIEVVGKNNQTLWSYLVTPSRFPWSNVSDDLARQLASKLLAAIKEGQPESPNSSASTNVGATLKGAGATFPAPLYQKWFQSFQEEHSAAQISYDPVGSAEGIQQLKLGQVDFAASEMPLTDESAREPDQHITQVPIVLGAVVPIYHLKGLRRTLNFTPEILAGVYLGKIRKWNDPEIKRANSGTALPDAEIQIIHRSDGSGTTFVWSGYLSKVSAEWKNSVGSGVSVYWPIGVGAERNEGVASAVQSTPNSIGYVEFIYAIQHELSFGAVRNAAGEFIKADIASVTEAARVSEGPTGSSTTSITDSPGKNAYPIATYTWLLLPAHIEDNNKKVVLMDLLRWMLTAGQRSCSSLGYAPLPADVANRALQSVDQIR